MGLSIHTAATLQNCIFGIKIWKWPLQNNIRHLRHLKQGNTLKQLNIQLKKKTAKAQNLGYPFTYLTIVIRLETKQSVIQPQILWNNLTSGMCLLGYRWSCALCTLRFFLLHIINPNWGIFQINTLLEQHNRYHSIILNAYATVRALDTID